MNTELDKTLKQLMTVFQTLKKLDPDDYYRNGMDKMFQAYVVKFAERANIQDPNLLTAIKHGEQNYGNASDAGQSGEVTTPELSANAQDYGGFNA